MNSASNPRTEETWVIRRSFAGLGMVGLLAEITPKTLFVCELWHRDSKQPDTRAIRWTHDQALARYPSREAAEAAADRAKLAYDAAQPAVKAASEALKTAIAAQRAAWLAALCDGATSRPPPPCDAVPGST